MSYTRIAARESALASAPFRSEVRSVDAWKYYTPRGWRPFCKEYSSGGNCRGAQFWNGPTPDACRLRYGELAYIPPNLKELGTVFIDNQTGDVLTMDYHNRNDRAKPWIEVGLNRVQIPAYSPPELAIFRSLEAEPMLRQSTQYNNRIGLNGNAKRRAESPWQTLVQGNTYVVRSFEGRLIINDVWRV